MQNQFTTILAFLIFLTCFGCEQRKVPKGVSSTNTIVVSEKEYSELTSIAFDSLLKDPKNWTRSQKDNETTNDTLIVELGFTQTPNNRFLSENLLGGRWFSAAPEFQETRFKQIILNPFYGLPEKLNDRLLIKSGFRYKIIEIDSLRENYLGDASTPIAQVKFDPIAFNKAGDYAIVFCSYYVAMDWAQGMAFFFSKRDMKWKFVGKKVIWVS